MTHISLRLFGFAAMKTFLNRVVPLHTALLCGQIFHTRGPLKWYQRLKNPMKEWLSAGQPNSMDLVVVECIAVVEENYVLSLWIKI